LVRVAVEWYETIDISMNEWQVPRNRSKELDAGVLSLKFVEERPKATAGPSTSFGSRNEPNSAQDDSFVVV
jgi:hypothetical protein